MGRTPDHPIYKSAAYRAIWVRQALHAQAPLWRFGPDFGRHKPYLSSANKVDLLRFARIIDFERMNDNPLPTTWGRWLGRELIDMGLDPAVAAGINLIFLLLVTLAVFYLIAWVSNLLLTKAFKRFSTLTATHFDDFLAANHFPHYVSLIVPVVLVTRLIPVIFSDFGRWIPVATMLVNVYMIFVSIWIIRSVLFSLRDYLKGTENFRNKPIESYIQVMMIGLYFIAGLLIFSHLTGQSVLTFLTAMGAASAILLLVFKDSILGFVASIQVSINDMVRIGDWVTLDKYGADGDVIEINLTTVKVQNFDKTITTIPTYALISDSFKNWRGMENSGGRRIKRALNIKISSIHFLSDDEMEEFSKVQLVREHVQSRRKEIDTYNIDQHVDTSVLINGRRMTNVGVFRTYVEAYLRRHPMVHQGMMVMCRQLPPTEKGLPIEIYTFTSDTRWTVYEGVMADIFDHLFAATSFFHLEVFELPSSSDLRSFTMTGPQNDQELSASGKAM